MFFVNNLLALMKVFIKENIALNYLKNQMFQHFWDTIYILYYILYIILFLLYYFIFLKDIILAASASPSA